MKTFAILLAAGRSVRFGTDKLWIPLDGSPLWLRSYMTLVGSPYVDAVGIVCPPGRTEDFRSFAPDAAFVVEGGESRQASCRVGLQVVPHEFESVIVHDAARAFVSASLIQRVVEAVAAHGAAFPAIPVTDTVKTGSGLEWQTLDRERLVSVQTPQGAIRKTLLKAHLEATTEYTDDVSLLEAMGSNVAMVEGERANVKVTHAADLSGRIASEMETRTGLGYDVHAFSNDPERPLWLGGVEFDDRPGLDGHSDADVLIHAIVDSLLGAAGLGDIGQRFSNTDPRWKDAPSSMFLEDTAARLRLDGWEIVNVDASVLAERPRVMPQCEEIRRSIGQTLGIDPARVSVKATTNERIGAIGRGEGVAAFAVATLTRRTNP